MAQETLVGNPSDPVNRLIADLVAQGQDVLVAAWARTSEFGSPLLHLVTPRAANGRSDEILRAIQSILRSRSERQIRLTDVKLVAPSDLMARDLMDMAHRIDSNGVPLGYSGDLGGTPVFGTMFVYPVTKAAPATVTGN